MPSFERILFSLKVHMVQIYDNDILKGLLVADPSLNPKSIVS
jgi:hypothetical protein